MNKFYDLNGSQNHTVVALQSLDMISRKGGVGLLHVSSANLPLGLPLLFNEISSRESKKGVQFTSIKWVILFMGNIKFFTLDILWNNIDYVGQVKIYR